MAPRLVATPFCQLEKTVSHQDIGFVLLFRGCCCLLLLLVRGAAEGKLLVTAAAAPAAARSGDGDEAPAGAVAAVYRRTHETTERLDD